MPKCQPAVTGCFWASLCAVLEAQICRISGNPEHTCAHTSHSTARRISLHSV